MAKSCVNMRKDYPKMYVNMQFSQSWQLFNINNDRILILEQTVFKSNLCVYHNPESPKHLFKQTYEQHSSVTRTTTVKIKPEPRTTENKDNTDKRDN